MNNPPQGDVEMTNSPGDGEGKGLPPAPSIPRVETTSEMMNLTLHQVCITDSWL